MPLCQNCEAEDALRRQRRRAARAPAGARLKAVDRRDVLEQERQVEHLELLRVAVEHRERRRDELHVAERERLDRFGVLHQLRRRIDLDAHAAREALLRQAP